MALTDSLISFWELEEASGSRVDAHGSNDLSDSGSTGNATGLVGDCVDLTPATTYLLHATNASLETGDIDWTIAGWVKLAAWSSDYTIISKWPFPDSQNEYVLYYDESNDELTFVIELGDDSGITGIGSGVSIPNLDTDWHFFVAGFDSVNNQIFFSCDNSTLVTFPITSTPGMHVGNGDFEIGGNAFGGLNLNGYVDQVGFWKRVLTTAEITFLYNGGNGQSYAVISQSGVNIGVYDAEMRALAWYDPTAVPILGWWDFGMPYEHDLIDAEAAPPPPAGGTWPGWITSGSIGWF